MKISYEMVMGLQDPEVIDEDELEFPYSTAYDFKMGICDIFALVISEKFGYKPLQIDDENGDPKHAFCTDGIRFVDASGWYDSVEELTGTNCVPHSMDINHLRAEIKENAYYQAEGYKFAEAYIKKYEDRYCKSNREFIVEGLIKKAMDLQHQFLKKVIG